jgi:pimeloyl-ACP methyl ester carboxylesterase
MPQPTQHLLQVTDMDGGTHRLNVLEWGDATNPRTLICVHGLSRNAHDFDYVARELCADYRVIAIDMAGRGGSDYLSNASHYNYGSYMLDCLSVMEQMGIAKADWLGTSMGGIIGMMIAAMHPDIIGKLILNDIGSFYLKRGARTHCGICQQYARVVQFTQEEAESILRRNASTFGITDETHWQHIFTHSIRRNADATFSFTFDPHILDPLRAETNNFETLSDIDLTRTVGSGNHTHVLILRGSGIRHSWSRYRYTQMCQKHGVTLTRIRRHRPRARADGCRAD